MSDITTQQYLTFGLGEEVFALETGSVREVIELVPVTRIPKTPPFMRGVINLRGHAVPVVDLRLKFGMPRTEVDVNTCIIIVEAMVGGELTVMGALADSVREVVEIEPAAVEPQPAPEAADPFAAAQEAVVTAAPVQLEPEVAPELELEPAPEPQPEIVEILPKLI